MGPLACRKRFRAGDLCQAACQGVAQTEVQLSPAQTDAKETFLGQQLLLMVMVFKTGGRPVLERDCEFAAAEPFLPAVGEGSIGILAAKLKNAFAQHFIPNNRRGSPKDAVAERPAGIKHDVFGHAVQPPPVCQPVQKRFRV